MKYQVENKTLDMKVEGPSAFGADQVLFLQEDNLIAHTNWQQKGFTLIDLFEPNTFDRLLAGLRSLLLSNLQALGLPLAEDFNLEHYHHLTARFPEAHLQLIHKTRVLDYSLFPIPIADLIARIEKEVRIPLTVRNPSNGEYIFNFRIVRPGTSDFNPLHRDAWHGELKGCLNLYLPVAGSNEHSSLCLIPGSHYWPEAAVARTLQGAVMNERRYTVPGLTHTDKPLELIRPNPRGRQAMLFTPYLIHGGAANLNPDTTRISVEIRFWRR
ncbi:MAG: phytanoyl-CoA dioxygenase family protein [Adhaeribacter sp.]